MKLPSQVLRIVLDDLKKVDDSNDYVFDFHANWHERQRNMTHVCLAGAVMAFTFGVDKSKLCTPDTMDISNRERKILFALNDVRRGWFSELLQACGHDATNKYDRNLPYYVTGTTALYYDMLTAVINEMEADGN